MSGPTAPYRLERTAWPPRRNEQLSGKPSMRLWLAGPNRPHLVPDRLRNRAIVFINGVWNYLRTVRPIRMITRIAPGPRTDELTATPAVTPSPSPR